MNVTDYNEAVNQCTTIDDLMALWEKKVPFVAKYQNKAHENVEVKIDHSNKFIRDGIADSRIWGNGDSKKILYLLKEAYTGDDTGYDLARWLGQDHPKNRMWDRVARWTYGIQNTTTQEIATYMPDLNKVEGLRERCFEQIAVLNIKKSSGESRSNIDEINAYAEADRSEIIKELKLADPDIVVCGSTFWILYETIFEHKEGLGANTNDNWFYYLNLDGKERLYIDYYHPANQYPDLVNYYAVMGIYQQALKAKFAEDCHKSVD